MHDAPDSPDAQHLDESAILSVVALAKSEALVTADLPACAGCGRCCHLVVELRAGDLVPAEMIAVHAGARCMDQHGDGACVALDRATRLCTIYDARPQTCRDFNRGEALCWKILGVV